MEIDPEMVEAKIELGWYYYHFKRDYEKALELLFQAKSLVPDNIDLLYALHAIYRRKGDLPRSLEYNLRAIEVDPGASIHWFQVAWTYNMLRDYSNAESYLNQSLALSPDFDLSIFGLTHTYLMQENKVAKAAKLLQKYQGNVALEEDPYFLYSQFLAHIFNRNMNSAIKALSDLQSESISFQMYFYPITLLKSLAHHLKGENELAFGNAQEAADILTGEIQKDPEDHRLYASLGKANALLGQIKEAIEAGIRGTELMPIKMDYMLGHMREMDLAEIYLLTGEYDQATEKIDFLLGTVCEYSVHWIRNNPLWEPILEYPAFRKVLEKYS